MYRISNIFQISESTKMGILFVLLICLVLISVVFFLRNADISEGFDVRPEPLRFAEKYEITPGYKITNVDIQQQYYFVKDKEGKQLKVKMPYGYYRVDDENMAKIPYGYELEMQGVDNTVDFTRRIIPKTNTAKYQTNPKQDIPFPVNGEMPDGMYNIDNNRIGYLPPGMKANVQELKIEGPLSLPKLIKKYGTGYVSESEYYSKIHKVNITPLNIPADTVPLLPAEIYYAESHPPTNAKEVIPTKVTEGTPPDTNTYIYVQFLPYGKVVKQSNGQIQTGYIDNPNLLSKTGKFDYNVDYAKIKNNYDVQFHDSVEDIKKQNYMYDLSFGAITVLDQGGNLIVLPRSEVQGDITFHRPDTFLFGASTYVPKYEDSVYLSRSSHMPTMAEYRSAFKTVGFCEEYKESPMKIEEKCNTLNAETCGSTACCVLLGGSKCVAGNETGPAQKQNYGDVYIRNKDHYMHMGKCYGNCP
jgi:hypothetical protein